MTSLADLLALTTRLFLPLAAVLAGLGYLLVDVPAGFTTAGAAMAAFVPLLAVIAAREGTRRTRKRSLGV